MTASTGATENDQSSIGDTSPVVIVTGMSGAGRSTALKALEDLGYEAVDNLPLSLLSSLLSPGNGGGRALAIGVDARTRFGGAPFIEQLEADHEEDLHVRCCFDCDPKCCSAVSQTRRRHPAAGSPRDRRHHGRTQTARPVARSRGRGD